jgi:hypothetical protein
VFVIANETGWSLSLPLLTMFFNAEFSNGTLKK